jgi:hypothetical protein
MPKELFLSSMMRWIAHPEQGSMEHTLISQVDVLREQMLSPLTQAAEAESEEAQKNAISPFSNHASQTLELDELWSLVGKKTNPVWIWIALCRESRQVVAYAVGDRSQTTCLCLWEDIPLAIGRAIASLISGQLTRL